MAEKSRLGYHVTLTLPADVEELIQKERQRQKQRTGYKPPRGIIISEAIRAHFGDTDGVKPKQSNNRARTA